MSERYLCQAKTEILALTPATGTSLASFRNVQNHQRHDDDALMLFLDITAAKWLQSDLSFYDAAMCAKPNHRTTAKVYVSGRMVERWPLGDDLGWCWYVGTRKIWDMNEAKGLCVWKVVSGVANLKQCFFFLIGQLTEEKLWKTSILVLPHTDFGSYWKKSPAKNIQNDYVIVLVSQDSHYCANAKISKFYKLCPNLIWLKRKTIQKVSFSGPRN